MARTNTDIANEALLALKEKRITSISAVGKIPEALKFALPLVREAVLQSPKLMDIEIEFFARQKSLPDDVVRRISQNRSWSTKPAVLLALLKNPKCPVGFSMTGNETFLTSIRPGSAKKAARTGAPVRDWRGAAAAPRPPQASRESPPRRRYCVMPRRFPLFLGFAGFRGSHRLAVPPSTAGGPPGPQDPLRAPRPGGVIGRG